MAGGVENLAAGKATQFGNGGEAAAAGRKGGKASGEARRRTADLRRIAQTVLDGTYKDKNGVEVTGEELIARSLVANLANTGGKNWGKAMELVIQLTGASMTPEQKAKIKAETELAKAKAKALNGEKSSLVADDGFLDALNGTAAADWVDGDD